MPKAKLRHGFKADAERLSAKLRAELKLPPHAPLSSIQLASHLDITLHGFEEIAHIFDEKTAYVLMEKDCSAWSATTIPHPDGDFVIFNSRNTIKRRESDLMHELSHVLCKHKDNGFGKVPGFPFPLRTYDEVFEEEAKCMGSILQLPRESLFWSAKKAMTDEEISDYFTASIEMVKYRRRLSGVDQQLNRSGYSIRSSSPTYSRS